MIKKISAFVLALVLCLSVVVVPANAAVTLGDATIAFSLEWDKAAYKAGDMAYLSVYMDAADDVQLYTGTLAIGLNSKVFTQTDNTKATFQANTTEVNETLFTYYKSFTENQQISWYPATIANKIKAANTDAENALYDQYLKITFAKNASGSHENAANQTGGYYGTDFDPNEPAFIIGFKVSADVTDGTSVRAAITSGSTQVTGASIFKQYTDAGNTNANENIAATATSVKQADTTVANGGTDVTIGAATIVNPLKGQMRYGTPDEEGNKTYDVRALAVITGADFDATFGDIATAKSRITEIGFVFAAGENVTAPSMDAVKNVVKNYADKEGDGTYVKKTISQISTAIQPGDYVFSCIVPGVSNEDAQKNSLVAVGYILYTDADGNAQEAYYPAAQTIDFADYYKA